MDALARARGFTLLEILVVVAIAAVLAASVIVLAWPGDSLVAEREARRLAALLELATAESRASGESIAWRPNPGGYSFSRRDREGDWQAFPASEPLGPRAMPNGIALRGAEPVILYPYGLSSPMKVTIVSGERRFAVQGGVLGRFSVARLYAD